MRYMQDTLAIYPAGKLITNFLEAGAVANYTFTVPAGRRWVILGGKAERDTAATFDVYYRDAADDVILWIHTIAAGATLQSWVPGAVSTNERAGPLVIDEGMDIYYVWGVAQTSPEISLLVLEIPLGEI